MLNFHMLIYMQHSRATTIVLRHEYFICNTQVRFGSRMCKIVLKHNMKLFEILNTNFGSFRLMRRSHFYLHFIAFYTELSANSPASLIPALLEDSHCNFPKKWKGARVYKCHTQRKVGKSFQLSFVVSSFIWLTVAQHLGQSKE